MTVKNASSWKLNKAEQKELADRVNKGENEKEVKKELQLKKAQSNEDRKAAAAAVAQRCQAQGQQLAAKAKPKPKAKAKANAAAAGQLVPNPLAPPQGAGNVVNKEYYSLVQADIQRVLAEYGPSLAQEKPADISDVKSPEGNPVGGVQEPFDRKKAETAIAAHGVYRCSVSAFWFNALSSATPAVPMSRRRVEELCDFCYGPEGQPRFHTDRMIEVSIGPGDISTDQPANLQVISPEEILHATFAGCSRAIAQFLG